MRPWNALVTCLSIVFAACTPRPAGPDAPRPAAKDACASYQPFTAGIAVATLACRGGLDPADFSVEGGQLRRAFKSCRTQIDGKQAEAAMLSIDRLLSIQARSPELAEMGVIDPAKCIPRAYREAAEQLSAAHVTCPVWKLDRIVGAPTKANVAALLEARNAAKQQGGRLARRAHEAESFELYTVAFPDKTPPQKCGSAETCAEACAGIFPGFVEARYGELLVGDQVWWMLPDDYGFGPSSPFAPDTGYVHDMANADPPAMYGAFERAFQGPPPPPGGGVAERCTVMTTGSGAPLGVLVQDRLDWPPNMRLSRCMSF